ncbi:MAG: radical SAM protein, partial [bacterium]
PEAPEYFPSGEISLLELKAIIARKMLDNCAICENRCQVNRNEGNRGKCRVGSKSYYTNEFLHFGEESELVPSHTVFFTGCTFECIFCQNWDIAHGKAAESDAGFKADIGLAMKIVEKANYSKNLNLVGGNPDQHIASILDLLIMLASFKYKRPIVWNSNLYMTPEALSLLSGVADVHLADFKYGSNECGEEYSGVKNYWDVITRNLLAVEPVSDILIRHLVLPGHIECCTSKIIKWVAENLPDARFNFMFQYRPEYKATNHAVIGRYLTDSEKTRATELASDAGLI